MRETIRPYDKTRKPCSSNCSRGGYGPLGYLRRTLLPLALLLVASAGLSAQGQPEQQTEEQQTREEERVPQTLATESDLTRLEDALVELARKTEAVATALEESPAQELRSRIEALRGDLETWSDILPELSVEPAEEDGISSGRYRRFERRLSRARENINSDVIRINEQLSASPDAAEAEPAPSESGGSN